MKDLAIVGPTASGKSRLALDLAIAAGGIEIVSIDSMQVYRGMDIGTAKPSAADQAAVPHHMIDLVDPHQEVSVAEFATRAKAVIDSIHKRGNRALLVGGTGLYFQCVVEDFELPGRFPGVAAELDADLDTAKLHARLTELDPVAAANMEPSNRRRVLRALEVTIGSGRAFSSYGPGIDSRRSDAFEIFGIWIPRALNVARIEHRVYEMLERGWLAEVELLKTQGISKTAAQGIGYKELLDHLNGASTIDAAREEICRRTKSFARRQRMWFRRDPRINWLATADDSRSALPVLLRECRPL